MIIKRGSSFSVTGFNTCYRIIPSVYTFPVMFHFPVWSAGTVPQAGMSA